jgi:hypothetical protein|tara:strand:- start:203 stop:904 length:702 start_codon:yes stop_codon:yes gene_type:complete
VFRFDHQHLSEYLRTDPVARLLDDILRPEDKPFTSQRWLRESGPKRMIFHYVYGALLEDGGERLRILDVGGGYTALTRTMVERHGYTLLDPMVHDDHDALHRIESQLAHRFWIDEDWMNADTLQSFDLVIANDLFPNVDQRLELFLEKFLPFSRTVLLTVTYYNSPRYYHAKRIDADELLTVLAWDGRRTKDALGRFEERISSPDFDFLTEDCPSLFENERQVCLVSLRGDGV